MIKENVSVNVDITKGKVLIENVSEGLKREIETALK